MHCAKNTSKTEAFCFGCAPEKKNTVATLLISGRCPEQKNKRDAKQAL
jgi:hypothetical protein